MDKVNLTTLNSYSGYDYSRIIQWLKIWNGSIKIKFKVNVTIINNYSGITILNCYSWYNYIKLLYLI